MIEERINSYATMLTNILDKAEEFGKEQLVFSTPQIPNMKFIPIVIPNDLQSIWNFTMVNADINSLTEKECNEFIGQMNYNRYYQQTKGRRVIEIF